MLVKRSNERIEHVLMKAFLWALYLPEYPDLTVEVGIGDRYKPDVVSLDAMGEPRFWGEAGKVSTDKIQSLARRYRNTHFALAKWDMRPAPYREIITDAVAGLNRSAPFDLIRFAPDAAERFIDEKGIIRITPEQIERERFP